MADNVFIILTSADYIVHKEVSLKYAFHALKQQWMDKVRVILWGPPEQMAVENKEFQQELKKLQENGVEIIACKACSDEWNISEDLACQGFNVMYVGKLVSDMLKTGWHQLTF